MSWSEVKHALNSTLGTDDFAPLDKLIPYYVAYQDGNNVQEFETPGSYSVNVPKWANKVKVTAAGGGGGGGYSDRNNQGTGGGGGAAILNTVYAVSAINSLSIVVGNCGSAGSSASTTGRQGGSTSITELNITLKGGYGGKCVSDSSYDVGGAAGGTGGGAGGKTNTAGSNGIAGSGGSSNVSETAGGGGGGSIGAGGDAAVYVDYTSSLRHAATKGVRGGGGGGGAYTTGYEAADGGDGYVKLEFLP